MHALPITQLHLAQLPLAQLPLGKSGEAVKAGPVGLGVILLLCIACYFLFKSMSKHMRKVRENFPAEGYPQSPAPAPARASEQPSARTTAPPVQDPPTAE